MGAIMTVKTTERVDRRQHQRYLVRDNTLAFFQHGFGQVRDISMGGLLMSALPDKEGGFPAKLTVGLLSHGASYSLEELPCRLVSKRRHQEDSPIKTLVNPLHVALCFEELSPAQQQQLALFIDHNQNGHSPGLAGAQP